jgi:hypothetical protein
MAMMRYLWDAATALDPAVSEVDQGNRFPLCRPESLRTEWAEAGLHEVVVRPIVVPTLFADFDDYWTPFLGGQGSAAGRVASLTEEHRHALGDLLRDRLPGSPDGPILLTAKAWAIRGTVTSR